MNDLISKSLKNLAFVTTAALGGTALHQLGLSHAVADLAGFFSAEARAALTVLLIPLMGVGIAELLSADWAQALFWRLLQARAKNLLQGGCPDLDGTWAVTWRSNDAINKVLIEAYKNLSAERPDLETVKWAEYKGVVTIEVTAVRVCVRLHRANVTEANASTVARLYREDNGDVVLTYQSQPGVHDVTARDSAIYNFAARLKFDPVSGELTGQYHTDRGFRSGQNSAGYLIARRAATN